MAFMCYVFAGFMATQAGNAVPHPAAAHVVSFFVLLFINMPVPCRNLSFYISFKSIDLHTWNSRYALEIYK
jgi:hypothetical protein